MTVCICGYSVLIDDNLLFLVEDYNWSINSNEERRDGRIYFKNQKHIFLHRLIMGCTVNDGIVIDHINGNTLDCRKENLRKCSRAQNAHNCVKPKHNTSGYKGVSFYKNRNKWVAGIKVNNRRINLGYFITPEDAYKAYCDASEKYHGEFGRIK